MSEKARREPGSLNTDDQTDTCSLAVVYGSDVPVTDPLSFLDAVYGTGNGYAHWALGIDGHFDANGKYAFGTEKGNWTQRHFAFPDGPVVGAVEQMIGAAAQHDVYVCPYLMYADKRVPGGTVERKLLHCDWDGSTDDLGSCLGKVIAVGGFAVASGTEGHLQVYVPLAESVPAIRHRELCEALARYLPPGADTKKATNDVMRLPGTWNHKARALGGESTKVVFAIRPTGAHVDPDTVARILGITTQDAETEPQQPYTVTNGAERVEPVDPALYPDVKAALDNPVLKVDGLTVDRSKTTMKVVGACYDADLTLAQTRWMVNSRADLRERVAGRHDDDVLACWLEVTDGRQERRREDAAWDEVIAHSVSRSANGLGRRLAAATGLG